MADAAVSTAHWLRTHAGRTSKDASWLVRRGRRTAACPELAAAWADGRLSSGQVDVIVAALNDRRTATTSP